MCGSRKLIFGRYPIIERAVSDMEESTLSDPAYKASLRSRILHVLEEDRAGKQTSAFSDMTIISPQFVSQCLYQNQPLKQAPQLYG